VFSYTALRCYSGELLHSPIRRSYPDESLPKIRPGGTCFGHNPVSRTWFPEAGKGGKRESPDSPSCRQMRSPMKFSPMSRDADSVRAPKSKLAQLEGFLRLFCPNPRRSTGNGSGHPCSRRSESESTFRVFWCWQMICETQPSRKEQD